MMHEPAASNLAQTAPMPTYLNGGPFDGTIRMVPESHTFMIVGNEGVYESDGVWGALRQFTWKEAVRVI